jgi:hypothetical protein
MTFIASIRNILAPPGATTVFWVVNRRRRQPAVSRAWEFDNSLRMRRSWKFLEVFDVNSVVEGLDGIND